MLSASPLRPTFSRMSRPSPKHCLLPFALLAMAAASYAQNASTEPAPPARPPVQKPKPDPEHAEQAFLSGARELDRKDFTAAQASFTRAAALNPANPVYPQALDLAQQGRVSELIQQAAKARLLNQQDRANQLLEEAKLVSPMDERVLEHLAIPLPAQTAQIQAIPTKDLSFAPPVQLTPAPGTRDIDLRGDVRDVLLGVGRLYNVKIVVDETVPREQLHFHLEAAPYAQAMPILLRMTQLFAVAVDPKTLLVVKDTQENRQRYERQIEETLFIPGRTLEQLNEIQNIVKNVFDVRQVAILQNASSLVIRAPEPTLKAVNATLKDLIDENAQIVLDLKLYSISRSSTINLGLNTPTSVGAFSVAAEAQSIVSANQTVLQQAISQGLFTPSGNAAQDIITEALFLVASGLVSNANVTNLIGFVGGGLTSAGIFLGSTTTLNVALNQSDSRALDDITLRAGDHQTSIFRVGTRYPITTSTYSSGLSSTTSSALAGVTVNGVSASSLLSQYLGTGSTLTIPQISYEDLGLTLKTTPTVLKSGLIRLSVDLKIEALTGVSLDNIPILTETAVVSDVTVPAGATALMVSQLSSSEARAISGLPGLASLPGFQDSLADTLRETNHSELILTITPHLVRSRNSVIAGPRIPFQSSVPVEY